MIVLELGRGVKGLTNAITPPPSLPYLSPHHPHYTFLPHTHPPHTNNLACSTPSPYTSPNTPPFPAPPLLWSSSPSSVRLSGRRAQIAFLTLLPTVFSRENLFARTPIVAVFIAQFGFIPAGSLLSSTFPLLFSHSHSL